jgi:hypothetical protein
VALCVQFEQVDELSGCRGPAGRLAEQCGQQAFKNMANLTAQQVLKRVQAQAQAKGDALKALINSVGGSVDKTA